MVLRGVVPQRLKSQSLLYHEILILQKFTDILGKVLKPPKNQHPTWEKNKAFLNFKYIFFFFLIFASKIGNSVFFTDSQSWNRQHHWQTIHRTEKWISMNLLKILCVVTWAWFFLTSMVMEAVRDQKSYRECKLWHNARFISQWQFCLLKEIKSSLNVHQ